LHSNAFELLVATILSAQCTDERVNRVTPALFAAFPSPLAMAEASLADVEGFIRSVNFFRNKAKNIQAASRILVDEHQGEVPRSLEALVALPGVGRKTANVVLGNAFQISSGIVVDTHVARLARRMNFTRGKDPLAIEQDLLKLVPQEGWIQFPHLLITHGREICKARSPQCEKCFLIQQCARKGV
jgi:endonuclease-3